MATAPPLTAVERRTFAGPYTAALLLAGAVGLLLPSAFTDPMGRETHYMALIGPANPAHPWTLAWLMAAYMAPVYGLVLPFVAGWVSERVARVGVLALGLVAASALPYLVRWGIVPLTRGGGWHGPVDIISLVAVAAVAVPAVRAGLLVAEADELPAGWVVAAGIALHIGMLTGMLATFGYAAAHVM